MNASLLLSVLSMLPGPTVQEPAPTPTEILDGLRVEHPRLLLTEERMAELSGWIPTDKLLQKSVADVLARADGLLEATALRHELKGPRLLHVSRACLDRVATLGLAWRITGDEKFAHAVRDNLLTVCAFPDWNPSHFLDTAEMSNAVGIGYDWCFPTFSEEERATIRAGLIAKGLEPGVQAYTAKRPAWWTTSAFNWNQVCNGGLMVGALAIAETDPKYAEVIVEHAVRSLPTALATYEPDGAWGEGPGYWGYATDYTVYGLAALRSALGHDFGLSEHTGLAKAGFFPLSACGPTGMYVAYADVGERAKRRGLPALFWLAQRYDEPALAAAERTWIEGHAADPRHVIWYVPPAGDAAFAPPRDQLFRGPVELALLRSAVDDPNALFVAMKGGYNAVNHGHLDLGNFELDAFGVRWARDLGSDDYNLPGYWDDKQGGKRWEYYRLGSHSHNVLTLDGEQQAVAGKATFSTFSGNRKVPTAILDIEGAWPERATRYQRGIRLDEYRSCVQVQDEIELSRACEVAWGMTIDAEIRMVSGDMAFLSSGGRRCNLRIESPAGAVFTVESAERAAPEKANRGVKRLMIRLAADPGPLRLTILITPMDRSNNSLSVPLDVMPLAHW